MLRCIQICIERHSFLEFAFISYFGLFVCELYVYTRKKIQCNGCLLFVTPLSHWWGHNMWDGVTNSFCIGNFFRIETRLLLISWDIFNPCAFRLEEFLGHLLLVCIRIRIKRHSFQEFAFATILNTAKGIL